MITGNLTGNVTGSINPSFTTGSVAFQGASGLTQDNANLFWDDTNNRLGIGTSAPSTILDVRGSMWLEGSPDISFTTIGSESSMLTLNKITTSVTGVADTTRRSGLVIENQINPSSGTLSVNNATEMTAYVPSTYTTAATIGTIRTGSFYATNDSTSSTAGIITPLFTTATARGEGTLTRVSGAETSAVVESSQTVTNAQSLLSSVTHTGTGVITNAYGLRVSSIGNSGGGTITNTYGVHVGDITAGTQTNTPYSFYASDSGAYNYFAGSVGIGTTTPSTNMKLDVNGRALIGGAEVGVGPSAGSQNTVLGYQSNSSGSSGADNTAIGNRALRDNTSTNQNTAVGAWSLINSIGSTNTAVGAYTMGAGTGVNGNGNTLIGAYAGYNLNASSDTDAYNTFIGRSAGSAVTTGLKNVILGSYTGNSGGLDIRTSSNNIVLSDGDANIRMYVNSSGNVGMGTTNPSTKLHLYVDDVNNNSSTNLLTIDKTTSGVAGNSIGAGINFNLENSAGTLTSGNLIKSTLANATAGNELSTFVIQGRTEGGALTDVLKITPTSASSGSQGMVFNTVTGTLTFAQNGGPTISSSAELTLSGSTVYIPSSLQIGRSGFSFNNSIRFLNDAPIVFGPTSDAPNQSTYFYSDNTTRMSIISGGNVGIGTTTPTAQLQVVGGVKAGGLIAGSGGAISNTLTGRPGWNGYLNVSGGLGTGGANSLPSAQRLTVGGNLVNIGSVQAGEINLTTGGTFATKVDYTTGADVRGVAVGDVNGDDKPDIVTANVTAGSVSVLINNGSGTFATKVDYTASASNTEIALGDLNDDGKLDIVVGGDNITYLLNNGDGTFASKVDITTGTGTPSEIRIVDVNGDGRNDVIYTGYFGDSFYVMMNNGDGTFASKVTYATGARPNSLAYGDLNGDGKVDVATANYSGNSISVFINNGDGTFATKVDYTNNIENPYAIAIADMDGDKKGDIIASKIIGSPNKVLVGLNSGTGTFPTFTTYDAVTSPYHVSVGDLNGDGKPDVVAGNTGSSSFISVFMNNGDGTLGTKVDYATADTDNRATAIADFNNDGKNDIVAVNRATNNVSVFINSSSSYFYAGASTGKVGVGTSSPSSVLSVASGTYNRVNIFGTTGDGSANLGFGLSPGTTSGLYYKNDIATDYGFAFQHIASSSSSSSSLNIITNNNGTAGGALATNLVTFLANGNVGIGTTNPGGSERLQVAGRGLFTDGSLDPNDAAPAGVGIGYNIAGSYGFIDSVHTGVGYKNLALMADNVGIGTTNPGAKLQVSGDVLISSGSAYKYSSSSWRTGLNIIADSGGMLTDSTIQMEVGGTSAKGFQIIGESTTEPIFEVSGLGAVYMKGNVGIGTTNPTYKLDVNGSVILRCSIVSSWTTNVPNPSCADVAEVYPTNENLDYGEVLAMDINNPGQVVRSTIANQNNILGIYSTSPGMLIGGGAVFGGVIDKVEGKAPVALAGRVPVRISENSEPIVIGDYLVSSDEPGKAMKATHAGKTIGQALSAWTPGTGQEGVLMMVNIAWNDPNNEFGNLKLKIDDLTDRVAALEASVNQNGSGISALGQYAVDFFNSGVQSVVDGIVYMKGIVTEKLTVGSAEKPAGIQMFDPNGTAYCVRVMVGGVLSSEPGTCDPIPQEQTPPPAPTSDTTPPIVTLNGDAVINLNVGDTYTEQGATATDDVDGSVSVVVTGTVDTNIAGIYVVHYNADDVAGNHAVEVTRTVNVVESAPTP